MSSVWEFIKRHKGKVVLGGFLIGGIYAGYQYSSKKLESSVSSYFNVDALTAQSRKHYIFDSNQRTCDNSVLELIPTMKTKLQKRFDIETLLESLKTATSGDEKLAVWQDIKLISFARLFGSMYSYTLLIVCLKVQISIVASTIYAKSVQNVPSSRGIFQKVFGSQWASGTDAYSQKSDVSTQQIFLQALHYFITQGSSNFVDKVEKIAAEVFKNASLKENINGERLRELLKDVRHRIDRTECSIYSDFIVPLSTASTSSSSSPLDELLLLLKMILDSEQCRHIVAFALDMFEEKVVDTCHRTLGDEWSRQGAPLAKVIPVISDSFHTLALCDFDSVVHNLMTSTQLHDLCVKIFENDSTLW